MKAFLMHRDRDFDVEAPLPPNEEALTRDLELHTLFEAMAGGDNFLFDVARRAVLMSLGDPQWIGYRQHVLADSLEHPSVVRDIYTLALEAIEGERKVYFGLLSRSPDTILHRSVEVLQLFVGVLRRLRALADDHAAEFRSEGFTRFFAMLATELDDEYFRAVEAHLRELRFRAGVLISAELGRGNHGIHFTLRDQAGRRRTRRLSGRHRRPSYGFQIAERDESGYRALTELRGKGLNLVANALAQSTDHILSFFRMLRSELGFYVGCLNLHARLAEKGEPACFPVPLPHDGVALSFRSLYDVCLTLNLEPRVVGNDVDADDRRLVVITGANQGGKSTFLRSVGLAQLMMQCGMLVAAESFRANVCDGVFTHYKREEDPTMEKGKLDEELSRMSDIIDMIQPNSIVLCNESFASTNEREGSEIGRQVIRALVDSGMKILLVTHLFDLAQGFYGEGMNDALFLRAERRPDGTRTFRLIEGEPLPTSYGQDLYQRVLGGGPAAAAPAHRDAAL